MILYNRRNRSARFTLAAFSITAFVAVTSLIVGYLQPEHLQIPVQGATTADWNHRTFWHPWGNSRVHKGIDIFAKKGTSVTASCGGFVIYQGTVRDGGKVVVVLGPKWRFHYYAHLQKIYAREWEFVRGGQKIGTVGTTGNAIGKPPHLHYAIVRLIPDIFQLQWNRHGIDRMFYLNPHEQLLKP